ncbi:ATP-grasp domain-containing protein [Sulfurospirillum sp. 1307]
MKKLLISGLGGSLFPYLIEKLNKQYEMIFIDSNPNVLRLYPNERIYIVPNATEPTFEQVVIKIIKKHLIDFYIPLIDEEILKAINIAQKTNIKVLAPSKQFVKLSLNKYKLMQTLMDLNISHIPTFFANNFSDQIKYPLFLKPNIGRGSRGIRKIENHDQFNAYFIFEPYKKNEVLVQPYIDGTEYTVSVTVNNLNQLISIVPKLVYLKTGITRYAKSIKHKKIEKLCKNLVGTLKPCGSFNVQLKEYNGVLYIFEINPRYSTTTVLSVESGINEIDLNIKNYNKNKIDYMNDFKETFLLRRWENIFYE